MRRMVLAGAVGAALCGPAGACSFSAADLRALYDRDLAPRLGLAPVSEYTCSSEHGPAVCDLTTPDGVYLLAEDAPDVHRASRVAIGPGHISTGSARALVLALAALCSPEVDAARRDAALDAAAAGPAGTDDGVHIVIGDVSYRLHGWSNTRIKDRRLPNAEGVNTSDDE